MHEYIWSHKHCSLGDNYSLPIVYMHSSSVQGAMEKCNRMPALEL